MREGYKDESEYQDKAPFLRKLKDADIISGTPIEYFEGRPDKLVRIWPLYKVLREGPEYFDNLKKSMVSRFLKWTWWLGKKRGW